MRFQTASAFRIRIRNMRKAIAEVHADAGCGCGLKFQHTALRKQNRN